MKQFRHASRYFHPGPWSARLNFSAVVSCLMAIALLVACGLSFGASPADILEIVTPAGNTRLTLDELSSRLEIETVTIQDPVYQREMSYDAFSLTELLHLAGVQPGTVVTSGDEVVFVASDGYAPTASLEQISRFHGYVAFQEHGKRGQSPFPWP